MEEQGAASQAHAPPLGKKRALRLLTVPVAMQSHAIRHTYQMRRLSATPLIFNDHTGLNTSSKYIQLSIANSHFFTLHFCATSVLLESRRIALCNFSYPTYRTARFNGSQESLYPTFKPLTSQHPTERSSIQHVGVSHRVGAGVTNASTGPLSAAHFEPIRAPLR